MLVNEAIQKVYALATGKNQLPPVDETKYTKILGLLNMYKDVWATESSTQWRSQRSLASLSATVTATDTFTLPTSVLLGTARIGNQQGDYVRVIWTSGTQESDFTIVDDAKLYRDGPSVNNPGSIGINTSGNCARRGSNLVFDVPFTATSPEFGGTIKIPVYSTPADMVSSSVNAADIIPVDDPMWLVFMAAAEYVRNDVTKQNQYSNLIAQAIDKMNGMIMNNEPQEDQSYVPGQLGPAMGETW